MLDIIYFLDVAFSAGASPVSAFNSSSFLRACLSSLRFLLSFTFRRRASAWSANILVLAFSAFFLWMNSMRTLMFLNTLPLAFRKSSWYRCLSIFLLSLYLLRSLLRTLILCIQSVFWQVLASAVPFLLASLLALTLDLEWTATGFLMTRPSLISFLMLALELALAISLISLGSNQTFFFPHFITSAARRF